MAAEKRPFFIASVFLNAPKKHWFLAESDRREIEKTYQL